ncbi:MAG: alpha/beta hydrolase [Anaerolineales bacterium]|nr:alpha/beta hydrolase [Anaerolineales bacterium]
MSMDATPSTVTMTNTAVFHTTSGAIRFYSRVRTRPVLEIHLSPATDAEQTDFDAEETTYVRVPFTAEQKGRLPGETCWVCHPELPATGWWRFRIDLGDGTYAAPDNQGSYDVYHTPLRQLWLQNGQIYAYEPAPAHSLSRVIKIPHFTGSLPRRALYIYLPRGYDQHTHRRYPVLYMHDGQNCFERYVHDSFSGSWRADEVADRLINQGQMAECIIVGVSNGGANRLAEYLPPYSTLHLPPENDDEVAFAPIHGRAHQTAAYYAQEVAPFIERYYRAAHGRENRATCGSSMGGLFSMYLAWEHPDFAKHHAVVSPSFWITSEHGQLEAVARLRDGRDRDVRLWLDSGTSDNGDSGDDGRADTEHARDTLLTHGYQIGPNFQHYRDEGAIHNEGSWAKRLPHIFRFLFPPLNTTYTTDIFPSDGHT